MKTVEINDAMECDFFIADEPLKPEGTKARTCSQCGQQTWAHTAACMWCGHDRTGTALRWIAICFMLAMLVIFPLKLGVI